jgi:hypothetical protein
MITKNNSVENEPRGRFLICGAGIYNINCPRYHTSKEAHADLKRYAQSREQSWLLFSVYHEEDDGTIELA